MTALLRIPPGSLQLSACKSGSKWGLSSDILQNTLERRHRCAWQDSRQDGWIVARRNLRGILHLSHSSHRIAARDLSKGFQEVVCWQQQQQSQVMTVLHETSNGKNGFHIRPSFQAIVLSTIILGAHFHALTFVGLGMPKESGHVADEQIFLLERRIQ